MAISLTTLCGFAALTVDVGMKYKGWTELQRTMDAAALAAAAALGDYSEGDIETYSAQLDAIFQHLGGKRPVILVE